MNMGKHHSYNFFIFLLLVLLAPLDLRGVPQDSTIKSKETIPLFKRIRLWGEFYDESVITQKNDNNLISFSHVRQGFRLPLSSKLSVESYLLLRYGKDLHRDFWNNRFESGLGLRIRFSYKIFLAFYLEDIWGTYFKIPAEYPQPAKKSYNDFRTGLIFWYGWDKYLIPDPLISFPFNTFGEIYSDISYYRKEHNNTVGYFHIRGGLRLFRIWKSTLDIYGIAYVIKDVNKDFWNNKTEIGPGIWFKPVADLELKIFIEWLQGNYFGIEGRDPNPHPQQYRDRRMGILFWVGW